MLTSLIEKAQLASMRRAFNQQTLRCPACGAQARSLPASANALIQCHSCSTTTPATDWLPRTGPSLSANPDQPPSDTQIKKRQEPDGSESWLVPPTGKFGFFLVFGILWISITAVVSGGFLLGKGEVEGIDNPILAKLGLLAFFSIFWAVGLGVLYAAIRQKYASHMITVGPELVTLRRKLFKRIHTKSLPRAEIVTVSLVSFYEQNETPVYGIEILTNNKKRLRFGSALGDAEKSWLAADLKRSILGTQASDDVLRLNPQERAAKRAEVFSLPFPTGCGNLISTGIFLTLFGAIFFSVGAFFIDISRGSSTEPAQATQLFGIIQLTFRLFDSFFNAIFAIFGLAASVAGICVLRHGVVSRTLDRRVEGDASVIAIRSYRDGRIVKERSFPRSEVLDVRATSSGHVNNRPMMKIDLLVAGKAERIASWIPEEHAAPWVNQARLTLGVPKTSAPSP